MQLPAQDEEKRPQCNYKVAITCEEGYRIYIEMTLTALHKWTIEHLSRDEQQPNIIRLVFNTHTSDVQKPMFAEIRAS